MSISAMKKLTVITPMDEMQAVVRRLVKLRCVEVRQIDRSAHEKLQIKSNYDAQKNAIEEILHQINNTLPVLNKYSTRAMGLGDSRLKVDRDEFILDGSYKNAKQIVEKTNELLAEKDDLSLKVTELENDISAITPWKTLDFPISIIETKKTKVLFGSFPIAVDINAVKESLEVSYSHFELVSSDKMANYCSVVALKSDADGVMQTLMQYGFVQTQLPSIDLAPTVAIKSLEGEINEAKQRIEQIIGEFRKLSAYISDVEILYDIEKTNLTNIEVMKKTVDSDHCTFVTGWVPEHCQEKVAGMLDKHTCAYEMLDPEEGEEPPVQLKNNGFASTFEWVIGMYSYPKYGSFDPTFIMSIFYFLIFGLMFADVGYGLILAACGFIVPKLMGHRENTKRTFYMFGFCGISSMIMGVIFGGWFGDLPYAIMQNMMGIENAKELVPFFNGIWFNPLDDPMMFLIVAIAAGGVHILAAMAINFVLLCKQRRVFDAIFDVLSWWIIFAGIGVLFLVGTKEGFITIGVGAAIVVLTNGRHEKNIFMKIIKGILGLYKITSYASDLLSYSRILALGLAAAVIGQVVNLVGTMGGASVVGFVALIAACIIGHTLNLAINILGSFVHTSRLQYLEFFNKFYEDGGEKFEALEPSEQYSKE